MCMRGVFAKIYIGYVIYGGGGEVCMLLFTYFHPNCPCDMHGIDRKKNKTHTGGLPVSL